MRERRGYRAIVVAVSSGGVDAVRVLLTGLAEGFVTPLIIVQHTGSEDGAGLCAVFGRASRLPVREAMSRERIAAATVYLAPPGYHLLVEHDESFSLSVDDKVCYVRPSADVLFESAADVWKAGLIGVVLTGANDDGARGLQAVRSRHGLAVVQQPEDAEVADMPRAALALAGADHVLPLAQIGPLLSQLCMPAAGGSTGIADSTFK